MKIVRRIQVWYEEAMPVEIPERELAVFGSLQEDTAECLLLTNDLEKGIEIGATRVRCLPVVKYLLLGSGG